VSPRRRARAVDAEATAFLGAPSLALGVLAALPLFVAYELGVLWLGGGARASAERLLATPLEHLGAPGWVRPVLLAALALAAVLRVRATEPAEELLARRLGRLLLEGLGIGILLGPLLVFLQGWLDPAPLVLSVPPPRTLAATLRLVGAAPWEELVFRVGLFGGLYLAVRRTASFLGLPVHPSRLLAELCALLGSALGFAWFHLDVAQRLLGGTGEGFHAGVFLWRLSAGLCLGGLFRLRGFGVAAWAHAVFNLGLALGIRP